MEEYSSDLDDEDMVIITRKFKKFFKRAKENTRKKNSSKFKTLIGNSSQAVLNVVSLTTLLKTAHY